MTQIYSPKDAITVLARQLECPDWEEIQARALDDTLPRIQNPLTKRGPLMECPYWECYAPLNSFYALVAQPQALVPEVFKRAILHFFSLVEDLVPASTLYGVNLMVALNSVEEHRDPPVRDLSINWYPFDTGDHVLVCNGQQYKPRQGDLILLDTRLPHHTIQPKGPVVFFSFSIHLKDKPPYDSDSSSIEPSVTGGCPGR